LEFRVVELIEDEAMLDVLEKRVGKVQEYLQQPYGPPIERPKKAKPTPRGNTQKFAGRSVKR
jgi:hypothetical protein